MPTPAHFTAERWQRLMDFARDKPTPFLLLDLPTVRRCYRETVEAFPGARIHYAVKANPDPAVLTLLHDLGACFDVASVHELDLVLGLGIPVDRLSYGNTIKKPADIAHAHAAGVRLFASDSEADIRALARHAPGARVFVRILSEGSQTADWPLSRKFGCHSDMAVELMVLAQELGLDPCGLSFHVGSQQKDIGSWDACLGKVRFIANRLEALGIPLRLLNMGGGLPAHYEGRTHEMTAYGHAIQRYLREDFGDTLPEILIEPGRALVGDAGILVSEVVLIARKSRDALHRWVYLDTGKFGGMIETLDECIRYPLYVEKNGEGEEAIIAGPTCDSLDILYERHKYALPNNLAVGDRLYWLTTGAYTTTYSSVCFNGFPPLASYSLD